MWVGTYKAVTVDIRGKRDITDLSVLFETRWKIYHHYVILNFKNVLEVILGRWRRFIFSISNLKETTEPCP